MNLSCPDYNLQLQLAFCQQGSYTRVMVMSIILPNQLWTVQHLLLFTFSSSPFFSSLITSLIFLLSTKTSYIIKRQVTWLKLIPLSYIFLQNNLALRNLKCDWFISFIQVGRNIFQKLYHTNVCTSSLYEFVILHGQTSWIIEVVSYKSFNVRAA